MKRELEEKIFKEFKFYKGYYGRGLSFSCGDGWYDLLYDLSKGIQELIDNNKEGKDFAVYDVKEKYGTLRYYCGSSTEETDNLVDLAEERSAITCELCGESGIIRDNHGWLTTLCETCHQTDLIRTQEMFKSIKGDNMSDKGKEA